MQQLFPILLLAIVCLGRQATAEDLSKEFFSVTGETRCPVCGMFVGKYPTWLAQVRLSDGKLAAFDGVKDLVAYTFAPENFGASKGVMVKDVGVKDSYSMAWRG